MDSSQQFSQYNDDDPGFTYHQDYYESGPSTSKAPVILVLVVVLFSTFLYQTPYRPSFSLMSLRRSLWDFTVYVTPYSLLEILDRDGSLDSLPILKSAATQSSVSTHDLKSEKMRRLFRLDRGAGIIGTVAQKGMRLSLLTREDTPAGLGNWDNSCYQNSVLQGLSSLDSLPEYLAGPVVRPGWNYARDGYSMEMAGSLMELIAQLRDPANNGTRMWTPAPLKNMSSFQQQDAQEYFSKVLDEVDKEVAKATVEAVEVGAQTAGDEDQTSSIIIAGLTKTRNPLEGMLAQRVGCTSCGFSEGLSMIPFNCLTVPIGRDYEYDVSECLDEYTTLERIEGVECGKCTLLKNRSLLSSVIERMASSPTENKGESYQHRLEAVTQALEEDEYDEKTLREKCEIPVKNRVNTVKSRQAVIARPPQSLVIHVNRSLFDEMTGDLKKNYAQVRFPKILDLGPWSLGSYGSEENIDAEQWLLDPARSMIASSMRRSRLCGPIYELRAVVTHYGHHENGHYICYRKHRATPYENVEIEKEEDSWWRLSDDDVMKVTEQDVLDQGGVFMLFYDRVSTTIPSPVESSTPVLEPITPSIEEIQSHAASLPLPTSTPSSDIDSASDSGYPEVPTSVHMSRNASHTSSDSGDEHITRAEEAYHGPVKPIMIKPFIQPHGYRKDDEDDTMTGKDRIGRSPSRSSSLVMV